MSTSTAALADPAGTTGKDAGGPRTGQDRYNATARLFHWAVALLIAGMYATDWLRRAADRASPEGVWWLSAHESLGLLVLVLTVARLGWRFTHPVPPIHGMRLIRRAAEAGHALLYLATLGLPLAGIGRAMAGGGDVVFFGFIIPSLTGRSDALAAVTGLLHGGLLMNLLLVLTAGHVLAGLWHQFLLRDGTLRRML